MPPRNNKKIQSTPSSQQNKIQASTQSFATGGKRSEQPNGNPLGPTLGLGFRDQD